MNDASIKPTSFSPREQAALKEYLRAATIYNEFGAGWTTVQAAAMPNITRICSVESNTGWLNKVLLEPGIRSGIVSRKIMFFQADFHGMHNIWGAPVGIGAITSWPEYYWKSWSVLSRDADLVLVDGRFRVACALLTALFLKNRDATVLIHDYSSDRQEYYIVEKYLHLETRINTLAVFKTKETDTFELLMDVYGYLFKPFDRDAAYDRQNFDKEIRSCGELTKQFGSLRGLHDCLTASLESVRA